VSEQQSLIVAEFTSNLERALEQTAKAIPRLDEDDRLVPILNHLGLGFTAPEYTSSGENTGVLTAAQVDQVLNVIFKVG
jgi:DNA primase large subunit